MEGFQKLTGEERKTVLEKLHADRGAVVFKFSDSGVFRSKAALKGWGQNILAHRPASLGASWKDQIVTGNFVQKDEFYFFNAKVRLQKKQIHLEITGDLFRLARRRTHRIGVPEDLQLYIVTKRVGDRLVFVRAPLLDFSAKGCMVGVLGKETPFVVGAKVTATLRFGTRKSLTVSAVVRHQKKLKKGRYDHSCGLEFMKTDDPKRLMTWFTDVQRESFSRQTLKK